MAHRLAWAIFTTKEVIKPTYWQCPLAAYEKREVSDDAENQESYNEEAARAVSDDGRAVGRDAAIPDGVW